MQLPLVSAPRARPPERSGAHGVPASDGVGGSAGAKPPGSDYKMRLPARAGYAMPAEWARHRATWIAWPHQLTDWPGRFAPIPWVYGEIVRVLSRHERVCILVQDAVHERRAHRVLTKVGVALTGSISFASRPIVPGCETLRRYS